MKKVFALLSIIIINLTYASHVMHVMHGINYISEMMLSFVGLSEIEVKVPPKSEAPAFDLNETKQTYYLDGEANTDHTLIVRGSDGENDTLIYHIRN